MSETVWINWPPGADRIAFDALTDLLGDAFGGEVKGEFRPEFARQVIASDWGEKLTAAIESGELQTHNPLTGTRNDVVPVGAALRLAKVHISKLRTFLASHRVGLRTVEPPGEMPTEEREALRRHQIELLFDARFRGISRAPTPIGPVRAGGTVRRSVPSVWEQMGPSRDTERSRLEDLPSEELRALYDAELYRRAREPFEKAEAQERALFFNTPVANADVSHWAKMPHWTFEESIALLHEKNPEVVSLGTLKQYRDVSPFVMEYERVRKLALRYPDMGGGRTDVQLLPERVIAWARLVRFDPPTALCAAVLEEASRREGVPSRTPIRASLPPMNGGFVYLDVVPGIMAAARYKASPTEDIEGRYLELLQQARKQRDEAVTARLLTLLDKDTKRLNLRVPVPADVLVAVSELEAWGFGVGIEFEDGATAEQPAPFEIKAGRRAWTLPDGVNEVARRNGLSAIQRGDLLALIEKESQRGGIMVLDNLDRERPSHRFSFVSNDRAYETAFDEWLKAGGCAYLMTPEERPRATTVPARVSIAPITTVSPKEREIALGERKCWGLNVIQRDDGLRGSIRAVLQSALDEGRADPPNARDVLEAFRRMPPSGVTQIHADSVDYIAANGMTEGADLDDIRKRIERLVNYPTSAR